MFQLNLKRSEWSWFELIGKAQWGSDAYRMYNSEVFARLVTCMSRIPRPRRGRGRGRLYRCAPETSIAFSLRTYNQTKRTTCSFENDAPIHSSFAEEFFYICWPNSILFLLSRFTITLMICACACLHDAYVDFLIIQRALKTEGIQ